MNSPIVIKLEVEGMRYSMLNAFSEHQGAMAEEVKRAVTEYCTPENLSSVVHKEARRCVDAAVAKAIDEYFRFGEGREAVKAAVLKLVATELP